MKSTRRKEIRKCKRQLNKIDRLVKGEALKLLLFLSKNSNQETISNEELDEYLQKILKETENDKRRVQ